MKSQANHKQQTSIKQEEENEIEINCKKNIYLCCRNGTARSSKQARIFFRETRKPKTKI